jgi:hypothetical protein
VKTSVKKFQSNKLNASLSPINLTASFRARCANLRASADNPVVAFIIITTQRQSREKKVSLITHERHKQNKQKHTTPKCRSIGVMSRFDVGSNSFEPTSFSTANTTPSAQRAPIAVLWFALMFVVLFWFVRLVSFLEF